MNRSNPKNPKLQLQKGRLQVPPSAGSKTAAKISSATQKNPRNSSNPPVGSPAKNVIVFMPKKAKEESNADRPKVILSAEKITLKSHEVEKLKNQIIELNKNYEEMKTVFF